MNAWRYLGCRFLIRRTRSRDDSSSHATWQNLDASSLTERTRLKGKNLHPRVSSEPLIEDEELNLTVTPNFAYKLRCSLTL